MKLLCPLCKGELQKIMDTYLCPICNQAALVELRYVQADLKKMKKNENVKRFKAPQEDGKENS